MAPSICSTWLRRTCFLGILATCCICAFRLGIFKGLSDQRNGGLKIDSGNLDFGEAWEAKNFEWKLPLHNSGSNSFSTVGFSKFLISKVLEKRAAGAALCFAALAEFRPGVTPLAARWAGRPRRRPGRRGRRCPTADCATGSGGPGAPLPLAVPAPNRG
jgi:hypothetical protein